MSLAAAPRSVKLVEIDFPRCSLTYGVAPCTASLGVTGTDKCFNTPKTCQDQDHYTESPMTVRFSENSTDLPKSLEAMPVVLGVEVSPSIVSLGRGLGHRESVSVTMRDRPHSDTGGFDKYRSERSYDPYKRGTFFGKLRARSPFLGFRDMRVMHGFLGVDVADMETRHYKIDSFDGPTPGGVYTITGKDPLKSLDDDKSLAPAPSNGFLLADIAATDTTLTLSPSGIGNAEYPATGYVAVGGNEICYAYRDASVGKDANTLLLLHFDGANGSTTFTDSSASARAATAHGNVQIDTSDAKFLQSAVFDGSGDFISFLDSNDWTPAGDFTFDFWEKFSSLAASRALFGHGSSSTQQYRLISSTAGAVTFEIISTSVVVTMTSATGVAVVGSWDHWAVVRSGNVWTLYKNGVSVATTTNAAAVPNYAGTLKIGSDGNSLNGHAGWMEEFRFSNVARWTTNFTPPPAPYRSSADILTLLRGQFNTEATTHKAQDRVQLCLNYSATSPELILQSLMVNYGGVDPSYITIANWSTEVGLYLGNVYTALIAEPTGVKTLIEEIIEQAALSLWWDAVDQQIRLRVLRAIATDTDVFGESTYRDTTLSVAEQPDLRVSQVWTYFAQINPLKTLDQLDNYRSTEVTVDLAAESDYGSPAIKVIYSRWIPEGGRSIVQTLNDKFISRYRDPPRQISFDVPRSTPAVPRRDPVLGEGYQVEGTFFQDATGASALVPVQLTSVAPDAAVFHVEAEEMLFFTSGTPSNIHDVIVDSSGLNKNVRTMHDSIYGPPSPGDVINFYVQAGVIVGSSSTSSPAVDVGDWTGFSGSINLFVRGRVEGAGGNGGPTTGVRTGKPGGTALYTRRAINLDTSAGALFGGGGGGGGSGLAPSGSGGAGQIPGVAGTSAGTKGNPGTTEAGGAGVDLGGGQSGGKGGDPGQAGSPSGAATGVALGGAAGAAIDGVSFVTTVGSAGDIRGGQVN